jgi:hypothetical protein
MNRLIESIIGEAAQSNAVIVKTRPVEYHVCPHCQKEIHEKSTFSEDGGETSKHTCGGVVEFPEPDYKNLLPWAREMVDQRRARKKAGNPAPKAFTVGDTTASTL